MDACAPYPESRKYLENPKALCNIVRRIVLEAGALLLDHFEDIETVDVSQKSDGTPVTLADQEAEDLIARKLAEVTPDIPFVGEERVAQGSEPDLADHSIFWLVDALDGTRSFIAGENDFTVNVALIQDGEPVLGVVYAPVYGELYAAHGPETAVRWMEDTGKERRIFVRDIPKEGCVILTSRAKGPRPKLEKFQKYFKVAKVIRRSSSIKICMLAAGKADLNPRLGPTCEWDTAAAHAVLRAAGGEITDLAGRPFTYGHQDREFLNPEFVASTFAWFDAEMVEDLMG